MKLLARYSLLVITLCCALSSSALADRPRRHKHPVPDGGAAIAYMSLAALVSAGAVLVRSRRDEAK